MISNQNTARRTAALLGAVVLTASLAACGTTAETDDDATPTAGTETTAPAESTAPADDDASDDADDATETDDATDTDDDADDASDSDDDSTDAAGTAGALSVSVQGQGVKALVLGDESTASGEATALNGKLISGPGG